MAVDLGAVVLAMIVAYWLRSLVDAPSLSHARHDHVALAALSLPMWAAAFAHVGLYRARHVRSRTEEFGRILRAEVLTLFLMAGAAFLLKVSVARSWVAFTFVVSTVFLWTERELVRRLFWWLRRRGRLLRQIVIVGGNAEAAELAATLRDDPSLGYHVLGFLADGCPPGDMPLAGYPVVGSLREAPDVIRRMGATGALIATTAVDAKTSNRLTRELIEQGVHVELSSSLQDIAASRLSVSPLGCHPVLYVEAVRRNGWQSWAKRTFDIVGSAAALIVTAPVLLVSAAAVKLTSRGPVLFRQERVGKDGKLFEILKLRTMVANAPELIDALQHLNEADLPLFKIKRDPRITPVGRVLRRFSIDELPQLWNVLRGEMSVVGPRPALPGELRGWSPELHHRLRVKPGVTGIWQVSNREQCSFEAYTRLDLYYVDNWSFWRDLAISLKTVPTLLFRRGY